MYLPKRPSSDRRAYHPMRIQQSRRMLFSGVFVMGLAAVSVGVASLLRLQERERHSEEEISQRNAGPRVVIIGAGTAGAALSATLCHANPGCHVTVIEQDKQQVFHTITPLAHVGHRSYDIGTGSLDFLRSPTIWNVSRDAQLVVGEVVRVLPDQDNVLVRHRSQSEPTPVPESVSFLTKACRWLHVSTWWGGAGHEDAVLNSDGSVTRADGLCSYPYDVLVVACGAERGLGPLQRFLRGPSEVDCFQVAVNPGTTRDSLAHMFKGNILHLRVPPTSFVMQMEAARKHLPPARVLDEEAMISLGGSPSIGAVETDDNNTVQTVVDPPHQPRMAPYMHYTTRQHDSTFVSTTNMIWKYLVYYSKLRSCGLYTITADAEPIELGPVALNTQIRQLWARRQASSIVGEKPQQHFNVLTHTYLTDLDKVGAVATLYNYAHNVLIHVPYRLLLLDLPLLAPKFITRSGLHRITYEKDYSIPQPLDWFRGVAPGETTVTPPPGCFQEEAAFIDVHPGTLQHRRYPNIFAVGDAAGLPSIKGYGATLAQVPVVAHNVSQLLKNARKKKPMPGSTPPASTPLPSYEPLEVNAVYDGYTSFPVMMTTWRAMWPEMVYNAAQRTAFAKPGTAPSDGHSTKGSNHCCGDEAAVSLPDAITAPLTGVNHHLWNNLAWWDPRGLLNAMVYQLFIYEIAHFFVFNRGLWYPPAWFSVPVYSEEDGTVENMASTWMRI